MGFKNVSLIDAHGFHAGDVIVAHGNNIIPNDFRAELLSLALHIIHEFRSHNAVGETRKILHFSGVDELPAWGQRTRDDQWFESSPAQVYGRGISGRAGSDNNHISQITHIPTVANHQSNQPRTARFHAFLFLMAYYQVLSKPDHLQSFT